MEVTLTEYLPDGGRHSRPIRLDETERICDLSHCKIGVSFELGRGYVKLAISGLGHRLLVAAEGTNGSAARQLVDQVVQTLDVQPAEDQAGASTEELAHRLDVLEQMIAPQKNRLRCFLSYRFTDDVEILAAKLQRFLGLLDIDVVTGAGYEPRPIAEKVRAKLGLAHDFVVLLISINGESMWTRDEISLAAARGIPVIPLVDEGAKFEPGLFGGLEFITFPGSRVEGTFVKLLEAIRFIRLPESRAAAASSE